MEMKNICGKIPVELHEKLKLEVEELGISIPKYLEMVIEEHMTRKGEKTNMADLRTVAVQVPAPKIHSKNLLHCWGMYLPIELLFYQEQRKIKQ